MIKANCLKCNAEFSTYPSKIKLGRGKYCSFDCSQSIFAKIGVIAGEKTRFKKGCKKLNAKGWRFHQARANGNKYIELYKPNVQGSNKSGYIKAHRFIMQEFIGRVLRCDEIVHHIDGNTLNNEISNLELMTKIEHLRHHVKDNIHRRWERKEVAV